MAGEHLPRPRCHPNCPRGDARREGRTGQGIQLCGIRPIPHRIDHRGDHRRHRAPHRRRARGCDRGGIVLAIALSLAFTFFGYLILDRDARGLSSLGASWKLVKPHFGALLGLYILIGIISFGLIIAAIVLGTLMLVVGLLITLPVAGVVIFGMSALSVAFAYRTIAGEPVAS